MQVKKESQAGNIHNCYLIRWLKPVPWVGVWVSNKTFWREEEISDGAAQWLKAQMRTAETNLPLKLCWLYGADTRVAWGQFRASVFSPPSPAAGLCSCILHREKRGSQTIWLLIRHGMPGASVSSWSSCQHLSLNVAGTKAYPGDGNHWTRGTCPEQARGGKRLHSFCRSRKYFVEHVVLELGFCMGRW